MPVKVIDRTPELLRELTFLAGNEARVGVLTGPGEGGSVQGDAPHQKEFTSDEALTVADVFNFHETGRRDELGPGHNWKRSSIVWVLENKTEEIAAVADRVIALVTDGKMTGKVALSIIGEKIVSLAKARIQGRIPPPLSKARLEQKKRAGKSGETPLIHFGQLINSLRYNVIESI